MNNISLKSKVLYIFLALFLLITFCGGVIFNALQHSKEDSQIINALGRQRMLSQAMSKSAFAYAISRSRKNMIEKQISYLDSYITRMRQIYTENIVGPAKAAGLSISMEPNRGVHGAIPFPATFTRMINEKFKDTKGFSVDIISEAPINPDQDLKTELDKEGNDFLQAKPNKLFSKTFVDEDKVYMGLYTTDKATTQGCVSCHSSLKNKPYKIGDILGIRKYLLVYSNDVSVGELELNADLESFNRSKRIFEQTLQAVQLGGKFPLDIFETQYKTISAVDHFEFQEKAASILERFNDFNKNLHTLLELEVDSIPYRKAQIEIIHLSDDLALKSNGLVNVFEKIAKHNHRNIQIAVMVSWMITVLILVIIYNYFKRIVINPVLETATVLTSMAEGDLNQETLTFNTRDEIGNLRQSFNQLLERIKLYIKSSEQILSGKILANNFGLQGDFQLSLERMLKQSIEKRKAENKLKKAQVTLEHRVQERTSELMAVNNDLHNSAEQLRNSEYRFRMVLNTLIDAFIAIDEEESVTEWNPQAEKMFGWTKAEALGKNLAELIIPENMRETHTKALERFLQTGEGSMINQRRELTALRRDGTEFPVEIIITALKQNEKYVFNAFIQDISERKMMAAQLNHAQKMESIGQLSAGIAHEINTPLQFIGDNTRFLKDGFGDLMVVMNKFQNTLNSENGGNGAEGNLNSIKESCDQIDLDFLMDEIPQAIDQSLDGVARVTKIVSAMKSFSHPGEQEKKPTDINKCILTTVEVSRNAWKYTADIETDLDPDLPLVPCFSDEFNQVILNLVVNAAHAMEKDDGKDSHEKGTITITTRQKKGFAEILVKDNGSGIPEEVQPRIFDPFFTTKAVGKGTGQGLAIVHSVVTKKHQGMISYSTEKNKGTTFMIRLPLTTSK